MFAVRRLRQVLLECSAIESLGLVRRLNAVQTKTDLRKDFPQICVDLPRLNESVCREHHPTPSRLWHSWQEHVCSPSSTQTQGSGRFPRPKNPHSWKHSSHCSGGSVSVAYFRNFLSSRAFQWSMSEILQDEKGAVRLILSSTACSKNTINWLFNVLHRLQEAGITHNEKCAFSQNWVKYLGQIVDHLGVRPDHDKESAIFKIQPPLENPNPDLHRRHSSVVGGGQSSRQVFPELSQHGQTSVWSAEKQESVVLGRPTTASVSIKISKCPVFALFDPCQETTVSADTSSYWFYSRNKLTVRRDLSHSYQEQRLLPSNGTHRLERGPGNHMGMRLVCRLPHRLHVWCRNRPQTHSAASKHEVFAITCAEIQNAGVARYLDYG